MGVNVVVSGGNINVGTGQAGSAAVSNSDDSYQATVAAGGSLELPDITITKNDDTTTTYPAAKDLDIGDIDECVPSAPIGWDAMVAAYGRGYHYPNNTGLEISYRTGDEWDIETTIFNPARSAQAEKIFNTLTDFNTLKNSSSFGNTNRFTDSVGGSVYGAGNGSLTNYAIDHYTGLGWGYLGAVQTWNNLIDDAIALSYLGFNDWFLASLPQIMSLYDNKSPRQFFPNFEPFLTLGFDSEPFFMSSTRSNITSDAWANVQVSEVLLNDDQSKAGTRKGIYCRKHY